MAEQNCLSLPPSGSKYPNHILMMCHGAKQLLSYKDTILFRLKVPFTIDIVTRIKTVDIERGVAPTVVADLSTRLTRAQLLKLGKFDVITIEHPPLGVYMTKTRKVISDFWDNVIDLLDDGGIIACGLTHFYTRKDAIFFGKEVAEKHSKLCFSMKRNIMIFTRY